MSFWEHLDTLVSTHRIIIDRPRGSSHPRYPASIYPLDYGYLSDTTGGDGKGIDIWIGTQESRHVQAIICTADLLSADAEIKIITGCTKEEIKTIQKYHDTPNQQGLLVKRK